MENYQRLSSIIIIIDIIERGWARNRLKIYCEVEENCHQNLQFVTWGASKRWQSYLPNSHNFTSGDASWLGRAVQSGV
jgi:hypothetical protein